MLSRRLHSACRDCPHDVRDLFRFGAVLGNDSYDLFGRNDHRAPEKFLKRNVNVVVAVLAGYYGHANSRKVARNESDGGHGIVADANCHVLGFLAAHSGGY